MAAGGASKVAGSGDPPGSAHDALPYPSLPLTYTQPAHLAALAHLFGLPAPPAERARVLELGCAAGGNIIPLATRFPGARFIGVDFSQRHISDGQQRIAALGLANVDLRHGDVATVSLDGPAFDYVICHGLFSWVSDAVQDAIFRVCRDNLAADGVVAVSYNVLPGWHLRRVIRDICLHHAGAGGSPRQRVDRARHALDEIAKSANTTEPYGLLLRSEAGRMARQPSAYILGEFLAMDNTPCYVRDFALRAGQFGLGYLCEGDLGASTSHIGDPATLQRIAALNDTVSGSGVGRIETEQAIDYLTGRPFRRSLLVHARRAADLPPAPLPERLAALHIACDLRLDREADSGQAPVYRDHRGQRLASEDPAMRQALTRLAAAFPATQSLQQLLAVQTDGDAARRPRDERQILAALLQMVTGGQATVSTLPLRVGRADAARPAAAALARLEAAARQPWVTSLQHVAVPMRPLQAFLIAGLDGSRDRDMMVTRLAQALRHGQGLLPGLTAERARSDAAACTIAATSAVEQAVADFARQALLEPGPEA